MSADNGIYILKTLAPGLATQTGEEIRVDHIEPFYEYRVLHAQCIENIYYRVESQSDHDLFDQNTFVPEVAYEYFKECQPLYDEGQALSYAHRLADQHPILEYGVDILDHGEQVFQTFTDEEIQTYEQRTDEIAAANRKQRDEEMKAKRNSATVRLSPGDKFHPTRIVGFVVTPNGERVYGQLSGEGVNEIRVGDINGDGYADFLPNDWDARRR